MKYSRADLGLLAALASLLRRVDPVPADVMADAVAVGLRLTSREPRLATWKLDVAWLLPE
jgi:hypothetical protein